MKTLKVSERLFENTKSRYLLTEENSNKNYSDRTAPLSIATDNIKGGTFISPNLATICEGTSIPFSQFVAEQGIDIDHVANLFKTIKEKDIILVSLGYGGISSNVIHFMSELLRLTEVEDPFSKLVVYEEDSITLMNVLRMYKDTVRTYCSAFNLVNKLEGFTEHNLCHKDNLFLCNYFFEEELYDSVRERTGVVYFGAPDYKTRQFLENAPFYFLGHGGDEVSIIVRPKVNSELTVETYGQIDLASFFPNVLHLTVAFLEHLAAGTEATIPGDIEIYKHTTSEELR